MYKRIYYDPYHCKIYLWEAKPDGSTGKEIINHSIEYYIPDNTHQSTITDVYGNHVIKQVSYNKTKIRTLKESGVLCCETDIHEATKFLHNRYLNKNIVPKMSNFSIGYIDIETAVENEFPDPINTKYKVNLISLVSSKTNKTYVFGLEDYTGENKSIQYCKCENENELLTKFAKFFRHCNFDILTGWYIDDYDVPYIIRRMKMIGLDPSELSPINVINEDNYGHISIAGLNILDYMKLYKEFIKDPRPSYSLDTISKIEIGEGKLTFDGGFNSIYKTDWNKFVDYNIQDSLLVRKLDKKLKLIELAINFSYKALIPFERSLSTIAIITGYMLSYLHKNNMVMNDKGDYTQEGYKGAYCFAAPGRYENVMSYDCESMYPHLIIAFNCSMETKVKEPTGDTSNLIKSVIPGLYYKSDKMGILPTITKMAFDERKHDKLKMRICEFKELGKSDEEIKTSLKMDDKKLSEFLDEISKEEGNSAYYDNQQYIKKILANSMYGVLGNPYFHYYNLDDAEAVTLGGQQLIQHFASGINRYFLEKFHVDYKCDPIKENQVVLVDTDSCYVKFGEIMDRLISSGVMQKSDNLIKSASKINSDVLRPLIDETLNDFVKLYNIKQIFNFKREKIITKMIILAKKRYVVEYVWDEGIVLDKPEIDRVGIDTERASTPQFCRDKLKELITFILDGKSRDFIMDKICLIKEEFKTKPIEEISSPTGINNYEKYAKPVEEYINDGISYVKGCPLHMKSAIAYNYMIRKHDLPYEPASSGTKIKHIYVNEDNEARVNAIGFVGKWPECFNEYFKINYEKQFSKTVESLMNEFFEMFGWEEIKYSNVDCSDFMSF
jgi:DNA polymerase elongation subunit (family B)